MANFAGTCTSDNKGLLLLLLILTQMQMPYHTHMLTVTQCWVVLQPTDGKI